MARSFTRYQPLKNWIIFHQVNMAGWNKKFFSNCSTTGEFFWYHLLEIILFPPPQKGDNLVAILIPLEIKAKPHLNFINISYLTLEPKLDYHQCFRNFVKSRRPNGWGKAKPLLEKKPRLEWKASASPLFPATRDFSLFEFPVCHHPYSLNRKLEEKNWKCSLV